MIESKDKNTRFLHMFSSQWWCKVKPLLEFSNINWTCHYYYGTGRILFKFLLLKGMMGQRYTSIKDSKLIKA
jgi:hypothetical protein